MKQQMQLVLACISILLFTACGTITNHDKSLFERIGGRNVLEKVSSDTLDEMTENPATKRSFEDIKIKNLKESLTNFLCVKTGGDCVYEGETMKKSHNDLKITNAEFELMVQALRNALDKNNVGYREKNELLKILAPMKKDIVSG